MAKVREFTELGKANRTHVFDCMDEMKRAFEGFVERYHAEFSYMDGLMASHNFHKLVVQDLADRWMGTTDLASRVLLIKTARDTFSGAMDKLIEREKARVSGRNI